MLAGVMLDSATTCVFISQNRGVELNPVLGALSQLSLAWVPIYLICRPLLVPLAPSSCRWSFCIYFGLNGLLSGLNNIDGIYTGRFFLSETIGYPALQAIGLLGGVACFIWGLSSKPEERKAELLTAIGWVGGFILLELLFFAVGSFNQLD